MPVIFHNTAGNGKISILQNGKEKGSFNVNQATDSIVDLTYETGTASTAGITKLYDSTGTNTDGTMTQAAINTALTGKAEVEHDHAISDITGLQSSLDGKALKSHDHDSRYYTETEIDTKLTGKSDTDHTHDDRYYTESEMDSKLSGKAEADHNHDDVYYTESEMDTKLNKKSDTGHKHSASDITSGTLSASRLPNIPVSKLTGTIAAANLPSYVDDVVEYDGKANFPETGEAGKIYVDTKTNLTYRWGGSSYVEISPSLALGTTESTAYPGNLGKIAYEHSQTTSGNPHKVTKSDVGLGNVDNTADANKSVKYATTAGSAEKLSGNITGDWSGSVTTSKYLAVFDPDHDEKGHIRAMLVSNAKNLLGVNDKLSLSGGTMTGNIAYKGTKATNSMIRFIDNTTDAYGNGISIGGGGLTVIGGGESATEVAKNLSVNSEKLVLANDGFIDFYTNCNNGFSSATHVTIDNSGNYSGNAKTATTAATATALSTSAGSATQPVYFSGGKPVACTYTLGKSVPSNAVFTDTNTKVTQTAVTSSDYTNWRSLIWGASNSGTEGFSPSTTTDGVFACNTLSVQPSTGTIKATTFKGNATTATTASNLSGFTNTTTSATAIDSATNNGHTYVNGTSGIYGQSDGAAFVQAYSSSWVGQIYQDYRTGQIALRGKNNGTWQSWRKVLDSSNYTSYAAPASHTHSQYYDSGISRTANTVLAAPNGSAGGATFRKLVAADLPDHNHYIIKGSYTGNGGQQNPSYIGGASVRFNMMNTTINSDSNYKDFILMDTYSGSDVPYVTALGIDKAATARAFIMSGKKGGSSWDYKAELISTQNIGSQSVNYATSAGSATSATNADKLDGYHGSAGASASTYVLRDSNNYVFLNYINSNTSNSENPTISQVIVTNGSDSYYRKASLAHLKSSLGSMPASDVYAWAKASTKPSYTYSEVGAAASSHTHNYAGSSSAGGNATWANGASYANKLGCNPTEDKTTNGLFMFQKSSDSTICPDTGWWSVLRAQHPGYTNGYWQEMAYSFSSDTIKFRRNVNGTKSSWKTIAFTDSTVSAATSAATASKLGTNAGSSTQPVYFSGGVPVACSYTLGKSVPSNAVFTDTNTWRGIQNNLTSTSTTDSLSAYQGKLLKGYVDAKEPTMTHGSSRQYYYKDGYTCYLNAWDVACSNIMAQLAEAYRPVSYSAVITGWCRNSGSSTYYPFVGLIGTNGYWQGYAMTSFGGGAHVIYEPNGTDRRSSFNLLVSGSWHTAKNSY